MKKTAPVFALLLAALFAFALFAGCAADGEDGRPGGQAVGGNGGTGGQEEPQDPQTGGGTETERPLDWEEDGVLRILSIGNSFSDDMMEYVWQIADSLGVEEISLGNLYIGGCSLDTHADNAAADAPAYEYRTNTAGRWTTAYNVRMSEAIAAQDWDFISFQQQSGTSGVAASYARLGELLDYVRSIAGTAQFVWHMTWAYQKNSPNPEFANYGRSQDAMYESIVAAVRSEVLAQPEISAVIPSGTAIQNARTSFVGDTLTRDGYHLSLGLGRYIAGLTLVRALTGLSVSDVPYRPADVARDEAVMAAEAAEAAVASPFAVTPSNYPV